jgi:hypothetical protein
LLATNKTPMQTISLLNTLNRDTVTLLINIKKLKLKQNYPKKPGMNPGALEE